jgi:Cu/Ag efflux pump CusA
LIKRAHADCAAGEAMLRQLIELCIRKRLAVLVVTAGLAAYGINAYLSLPIEAYPDVSNVQVKVIAQLPGQAPEEIERQVTVRGYLKETRVEVDPVRLLAHNLSLADDRRT